MPMNLLIWKSADDVYFRFETYDLQSSCMHITNTENYAIKRSVHIVLMEVKTR